MTKFVVSSVSTSDMAESRDTFFFKIPFNFAGLPSLELPGGDRCTRCSAESVTDALDPGDDALLDDVFDVDVWRDMSSDEFGGDSSLVGVGVCLCQLWGGVGGGGKVCGNWLARGGIGAICKSDKCWGRTC